jgi:hypothetical protein
VLIEGQLVARSHLNTRDSRPVVLGSARLNQQHHRHSRTALPSGMALPDRDTAREKKKCEGVTACAAAFMRMFSMGIMLSQIAASTTVDS